MTNENTVNCGAVVIGRNEGERLDACLRSLVGQAASIVYVDSGSSDNSLDIARAMNAEIVQLDLATPFTAARARNEGFKRLNEMHDDLAYVQFVDGDCIVDRDWVGRAHAFLEEHEEVAVVCGRLREQYPERSVYNRLCDVEWEGPTGEITACGGIAMIRVEAFSDIGGFRIDMIAGEEPELCVRLRVEGWKIWRLDEEMTLHDAAISTFRQWWKRTMRGGYAYALGAALHGASPERHSVTEVRRALAWSALLPGAFFLGMTQPLFYFLLLLYPLQVMRLACRRGAGDGMSWAYGLFMTIAKFAESAGIIRFHLDRVLHRRAGIIEYK